MSNSLPYSTNDVQYNNAKFRHRSFLTVLIQPTFFNNVKLECVRCGAHKFLVALLLFGLAYVILVNSGHSDDVEYNTMNDDSNVTLDAGNRLGRFLRRPPRFSPRLSPDELLISNHSQRHDAETSKWEVRQKKVREAFIHAWSGYKSYAMGFDELMPLTKMGTDGLGGLGATVVDALDTAMIMRIEDIVSEAGSWVETHLAERISHNGPVNLFETTIRILGGLLSAYHLSEEPVVNPTNGGPKPSVYLEISKMLGDRLLSAFTSSPTPIPFSDVILHNKSACPAPDGLSSTSEVSTLQLEFNYLSEVSGDPKYSIEAMDVMKYMSLLTKVEGLVPIYISPHSGDFVGKNIKLGSRGDSYYEYLMKVWLQQGANKNSNLTYMRNMYEEAMQGVKNLLVRKSIPNGLVFVGELPKGASGAFNPKMDHLVCFLPGTLALGATKGITKSKALKENLLTLEDLENIKLAEDLTKTCFEMYTVTSTGLAPEIAYFHVKDYFEGGLDGGNKSSIYSNDIIIKRDDRHNLLRPETVESLFILYRITEDPKYREWGWRIFEAFENYTKVDSGGYTSLEDVTVIPPHKRDKMETFFMGETLKYLYLLFGDINLFPLDQYVFSTEAHPIPIRGRINSQ